MNEPKKSEKLEYRNIEEDPSIRRSALMRTPPNRKQEIWQEQRTGERAEESVLTISDSEETAKQPLTRRSRANSLPESTILLERVALPWEMEEERPAKRKRERAQNTPTSTDKVIGDGVEEQVGKLVKENTELVKKVRDISRMLSELVVKNPNTKVEIKRGVEELEWLSSRLVVKGDKMVQPIQELLRRDNKIRAEAATQTESRRGEIDKEEQENREVDRIQEVLNKGGGMEEFLEVAQNRWPQRCFRKVKTENKDIFELPRDWDPATMVPANFEMENGDNQKLGDHFQGLEELRNQEAGMGGVAYLVEQVGIPGKNGEIRTKSRYVYYGVITEVGMDTCNVREVLACLSRMRDLMIEHQRGKLAIVTNGKINAGYLRKAVEFVFAKEEMEIILLTGKKKTTDQRNEARTSNLQKDRRGRREEALIIKVTDRKPYAEMLQELRKEVDLERTGVKVTTIRKTRSGDILMSVKAAAVGERDECGPMDKEVNRGHWRMGEMQA